MFSTTHRDVFDEIFQKFEEKSMKTDAKTSNFRDISTDTRRIRMTFRRFENISIDRDAKVSNEKDFRVDRRNELFRFDRNEFSTSRKREK